MRTPCVFRLTFLLPPAISLLVQSGRHQPCLHGCVLTIHQTSLVSIEGPSKERVFEQASRFLRVICRGRPALSICATLASPPRFLQRYAGDDERVPTVGRGGRDGWSIIVGAEIAFSPTSLPPEIMPAQELEQAG